MENIKLKENDILISSWGYGCTLIDYFKVISKTEKTVKLQKLEGIKQYSECGRKILVKPTSELVGEAFTKKINYYEGKPVIRIESFQRAYLWDGIERRETED